MSHLDRNFEDHLESPRRLGMTASVWLLIAGFCGLIEFAGSFANDGFTHDWNKDVVFIVAFALLGGFALLNAIWIFAEQLLRRN